MTRSEFDTFKNELHRRIYFVCFKLVFCNVEAHMNESLLCFSTGAE